MNIDDFLKIPNFDDKTAEESLVILGNLIDLSHDMKRMDGIDHALMLGEEVKKKSLSAKECGLLNYFLSNAWDDKRRLLPEPDKWGWDHHEVAQRIIYLRRALNPKVFRELGKTRVCQILTNLGNLLNEVGRVSEAFECWYKALKLDPEFSMAQANKGYGAYQYASDARFSNHYAIHLLRNAYFYLKEGLRTKKQMHEGAAKFFEHILLIVLSVRDEKDLVKKPKEGWLLLNNGNGFIDRLKKLIGRRNVSEEEKYRNWCLAKRLFINPLNDLGPVLLSAKDDLYLPSITTGINEGPKFHGLFNQIKQEFVSARFLYYEAVSFKNFHYSDKDVSLANTLDYPSYCLAVEQMKLAYRSFYSILDKIAFFLNDYLKLGISHKDVAFKRIWYTNGDKKQGLRGFFINRRNRFLRALYWLSKDLYEKGEDFTEALEPDAKELEEIRNHLEHKYLKVHEFGNFDPKKPKTRFMDDELAYSVSRNEFAKKTERTLRFARAAIIYLVLAIHREETMKEKNDPGKPKAPIQLDGYDDEWKR